VIDQITEAADQFKKPVIACLGLAFKADIDDLRESPALQIVEHLAGLDIADILAVEPNIKALPKKLAEKNVELVTLGAALEEANVIVVLVDHKQFKAADKSQFAKKVIIDTRGIV
jgi:UDP-N-acetyl-D-mannosaminuronic acid dehydrogenase